MKSKNKESQKLKALVRDKYSEIAIRWEKGETAGCCGPTGCCEPGTGEKTGDGIYFDIMAEGTIPEPIQKAAEAYVGCVSGAMQKEEYLEIVRGSGFTDVTVLKEREIVIPQDWLNRMLGDKQSSILKTHYFRVLSITINGNKP